MNKITEFQLNRGYYSQKRNSPLFHLEERDGKDLTFKVIHYDDPFTKAKGTVEYATFRSGTQEIVHISCAYGDFDLAASVVVPIGRKFSTLPKDKQKRIDYVIKKDREVRKNLKLDHASITTIYSEDTNSQFHYEGHLSESTNEN